MASHPDTNDCAGVVSPLLQQTRTTLNIEFYSNASNTKIFSQKDKTIVVTNGSVAAMDYRQREDMITKGQMRELLE